MHYAGLRARLRVALAPGRGTHPLTDLRALLTLQLTLLPPLRHGSGGARPLHLFLSPGLEFRPEAGLVGQLLLLLRQM